MGAGRETHTSMLTIAVFLFEVDELSSCKYVSLENSTETWPKEGNDWGGTLKHQFVEALIPLKHQFMATV